MRIRPNPFKRVRYGGWALYCWYGMRFGAWLHLLRRGRYDITLNTLPDIIMVTLVASINSALYWLSEALFRDRAEAVPLDAYPPVFILGHWRTGTTFLHELFGCNPAFAFPTVYECTFPNHFLLTERLFARFSISLPKKRPQDDVPISYKSPMEDEFAYSVLGMGTPYNTMAWPRHGPADNQYLDLNDLSEVARLEWTKRFLWFYRRLLFKHRKPLVLKSPPHTARIKHLITLFPQARFIHIARNPLDVVPSTVRVWRVLYSVYGLHNPPNVEHWIEPYVLDTFVRLSECYAKERELIPEGQLIEIHYEDLVANPKGVLREIYQRLSLGEFARAEQQVDTYLAARQGHQIASHQLSDGLRERVAARLGAYIDAFGYRPELEADQAKHATPKKVA